MSTASMDFEQLLRGALEQAAANGPQANRDLLRIASEAADAVSKVTAGAAILELAPIDVAGDLRPAYQLRLRKDKSEAPPSDLGVFRLSESGYPIQRWATRRNWELRPEQPDNEHMHTNDLKSNFDWMLSKPDSKLVVLVNFLNQQATSK